MFCNNQKKKWATRERGREGDQFNVYDRWLMCVCWSKMCCYSFLISCVCFVRCRSSTIPLSLSSIRLFASFFFRDGFWCCWFSFPFLFRLHFVFCKFCMNLRHTHTYKHEHQHQDHPFNFLRILQHAVLQQLFINISNTCTIALHFSSLLFLFWRISAIFCTRK